MKSFYEHLEYEKYMAKAREYARKKRRIDRAMTRNEMEQQKSRRRWILAVVVWAVIVGSLFIHTMIQSGAVGEDPTPAPIEETELPVEEHVIRETEIESKEIPESMVPKAETPMDDAVAMIAKVIWGEARGCSTMEQAAVAWNILNRVDSPDFPNNIEDVILYKNAYEGYSPDNPVLEEHLRLAEDVLDRWTWEKWDGGDYDRVLPKEYTFFHGDGNVNWFRAQYKHTGEYWDWSLPNPYEEE